jgi:hypothetical protein
MRTTMIMTFATLAVAGLSITAAAQNNPQPSVLTIHVRDYCDPASFDAALGTGACNRDPSTGAITFMGFLTELSMDKSVGALAVCSFPITSRGRCDLEFTKPGR